MSFWSNNMQLRSISRTAQALMIAATLAFSSLASAEPSLQDINQTLKNGDFAKADTLMKEVVSVHPESAKAHFKYAEILAAEGKIDAARVELSHAEKLQPNLDFAKPAAVQELNHKLYQTKQASQGGYSTTSPLITWAVIALIVFFVIMIVRALRRPQIQPTYVGNPQIANGYPQQGPYQGGYGPQGYGPQGGGVGSGIVGGLATGAAVGAGIVAGEMLMHKVLDDDHPSNHDSYTRNQPAPDNYNDISGNDFVDNDNGSWDSGSSGSDFSSDSDSGGDWS
jgi:hypothetical protein